MEKDFTLFQVGWFTRIKGNEHRVEQLHTMFRTLIEFMQKNQLTTRVVMRTGDSVSDNSCLMKSDLTDTGFKVYQKAEQKWLRGTDRGKSPTDITVFEREFLKLK